MIKRDDIQWLRALAIFAVLCFHLWPKIFPYGYLGVDIFFVISGYLMTTILFKPSSSKSTFLDFYFRRIKRIFPTCLFVITVTLFIGYNLLLYTHFWGMLMEGLWSIFFINNLSPIFLAKHYFDMASEYKFLLHTWSLGVEVQFYLIAPFLLKFINAKEKPLHWIFAGILLSASTQLLIPLPHITFGFVFCRIWQFLIGTAAYYQSLSDYQLLEKCNNKNRNGYYLTWIFLIAICFNPIKFEYQSFIDPLLRMIATVIVGNLIMMGGKNSQKLPNFINQCLVYFGDASYSLYLIHWPIIVIFKYFGILNSFYYLPVILLIIFTTIIIHETFEKTLIQQSWAINGILIAIFYASILSTVAYLRPLKAPDEIEFLDTNDDKYNPILANEMEAASCWNTYYPCENGTFLNELFKPELLLKPNCSYTLSPKRSNKTIVILGNSFALNQSKGILNAIKAAKTKFNKAYLLVVYGCNVLTGNLILKGHPHCTKVEKMHSNFLEALKPDMIIFSGRFDHIGILRQPLPPESEIAKHNNYIQLQNILKYANYTKKFILIEPNPMDTQSRKYNSPLTISEDLLAGRDISNQYIRSVKDYNATNYRAWEWVKVVVKKFKNCKIISTKDLFCDEKNCNFVEPKFKLGLYCDESHITPRTSLKLIPRIKDAIDN